MYTLDSVRADMDFGSHSWACFKAQQAAEYALKALLRSLGRPAFGHNLVALFSEVRDLCDGVDNELALCVGYLDKLYVPPRYPDAFAEDVPYERFTKQESEMARGCAERIVKWIRGCSRCESRT